MEKANEQLLSVKKEKLRLDKLVDATDIEGKKNEKLFEVTKKIEQELSEYPQFIGVFPYGSQMKGYSDENAIDPETGEKGSDYDIYIIVSENPAHMFTRAMKNIADSLKNDGISMHFKIAEFDIYEFSNGVKGYLGYPGYHPRLLQNFEPLSLASVLCGNGRGDKINPLRSKIRDEILKFPASEKEVLLKRITDLLTEKDELSLEKIEKRILKKEIEEENPEEKTKFNRDEWLRARHELWEHRVHKIFDEEQKTA